MAFGVVNGRVAQPFSRAPRVRAAKPKAAPKARKPRSPAKAAQASNPLYDPSVTLSGPALVKAATAMTDAAYQPQIADIKRQQGSNVAQGTQLMSNASDYYRGLAAEEAKGIARETAIGQLLQQQQGSVGQAAQGAFGQMSSDEAAREAADQAVRGGGLGGGGGDQVAAAIAGGQGRSAQYQQAAQDEGALQASNWESLANANLQARQVHGGEVQGQLANSIANTNKSLVGKLTDLSGQRANELVKNLVALREQGFTNAATLAGLNLKQSDIAAGLTKADKANATANRRITVGAKTAAAGVTSREGIASANRTAADKRAATAAKTKADAATQKHLTTVRAASEKAWAPVETALGQVNSGARVPVTSKGKQTYDAKGQPVTRPATTQETVAELRNQKVPEWGIQAILDIRHSPTHTLSPPTIALIHSQAPDVRIPGRYLPSKRLANFPT